MHITLSPTRNYKGAIKRARKSFFRRTRGFDSFLTKDIPPFGIKKLRKRDGLIRKFFNKRISRLKDKKRYTAGIVEIPNRRAPLLGPTSKPAVINTQKVVDDLIKKNKNMRDKLIADNKLFQRNMTLKNDALIEKVRVLGEREKRFQSFAKPEVVRQPLPLVAPIETLTKKEALPLPFDDPPEKRNLLLPIGVGIAALLMFKG